MSRSVLVAGAGFAGLEAMLALRVFARSVSPSSSWRPDPDFVYRPLAVAEPFGLGEVHRFPLGVSRRALRCPLPARPLAAVDAPAGRVKTSQGEALRTTRSSSQAGRSRRRRFPGALTFQGPQDVGRFSQLVKEIDSGIVQRVAFAVPAGVSWPLPLYELTLLTARHARSAARARRSRSSRRRGGHSPSSERAQATSRVDSSRNKACG